MNMGDALTIGLKIIDIFNANLVAKQKTKREVYKSTNTERLGDRITEMVLVENGMVKLYVNEE